MPEKFSLTKREMKCDNCGGALPVPFAETKTILQCAFCGTAYEYNPTIQFSSVLIFEGEDTEPCRYDLVGNAIIGRENSRGYVTLRYEIDESIKEDTHVRNPFVSRPHAKITVKEEFVCKGNSKNIIVKKKCVIEDCGSTNGTSVNDEMLIPYEAKELKHGDRITLAPTSRQPLTFVFRESIETR